MTQPNDFLLNILEADEQGLRGIFQNFGLGGPGLPSNEQRIGTGLFQPVFNQFLGQIAGELEKGIPEGGLSTFRGFLGSGGFNFQRELLKSNDQSFSNQNVQGRAGTLFDFGQSKARF